jgi:hypothetical protein
MKAGKSRVDYRYLNTQQKDERLPTELKFQKYSQEVRK